MRRFHWLKHILTFFALVLVADAATLESVLASSALSLSAVAQPDQVPPGTPVAYSVTLKNAGTASSGAALR